MTRSVQKVEGVLLPVRAVLHLNGVALYGNSLLLLKIHGIQDLGLHLAAGNGVCKLEHPVGKGGFAVVNMGYYAKVSDIFHRDAKITYF